MKPKPRMGNTNEGEEYRIISHITKLLCIGGLTKRVIPWYTALHQFIVLKSGNTRLINSHLTTMKYFTISFNND